MSVHTKKVLDDADALDPDTGGWLAWLGQLHRTMRITRAASIDLWQGLRSRAVIPSILLALLAVAGVVAATRHGEQLRGWLASLGWVAAGIGVTGAVFTPLRLVWSKARTMTTVAQTQLLLRQQKSADKIRNLEEKLTELDPALRLDQLLTEISASDRYATYRGLTGRIHDDLRRLNQQLVEAHRFSPDQQWRIILYVDDLDRCTASRVVEVLQAVNLLLSMELFLVVVAVDPRWLLRAIEEQHGSLLNAKPTVHTTDGDYAKTGRPLDYLDKIFHIPYAVRPAGTHATDYLRSLLPVPAQTAQPSVVTAPGGTRSAPPRSSALEAARQVTSKEAKPDTDIAEQSSEVLLPVGSTVETETAVVHLPGPVSVASLEFSRSEVDFLALLTNLLPTPRSMKKLANLYRLLRIAVPSNKLSAFLDGTYQAPALLLACIVGNPGQARDLLGHLLATKPEADIVQTLRTSRDDGAIPAPANRLADYIEELARTGSVHMDPGTYRTWATVVARYSFETYELFTG